MISIAEPLIDENEKKEVLKVLDSGMLAHGKYVNQFEEEFASFIGCKYGVATASGTAALHVALLAAGISEGDKVLTTSFSFIASSNAILYCEARPVFADIDENTFNISAADIEKKLKNNPDIKALLIVHLYGLTCEMDKIMELVEKYDLTLIEDCAQAHGARYKGKNAGTFGDVSVFSFYPSKNITTGEGGILLTEKENIKDRAANLIDHGATNKYNHEVLGYNYRMTNIAAAIGVQQLKKLNQFNRKRRENAYFLTEELSSLAGIITPDYPEKYYHIFHLYTIKVLNRGQLAEHLKENEIGFGIHYPVPLYRQPLYKKLNYDQLRLSAVENVCRKVISLPVHPGLSDQDLKKIVNVIKEYYD